MKRDEKVARKLAKTRDRIGGILRKRKVKEEAKNRYGSFGRIRQADLDFRVR